MDKLKKRLTTLEQRTQRQPWRVFTQSWQNPALYFEGVAGGDERGQPWTAAQVQALLGEVCTIEYVKDWRGEQ